MIGYTVNAKVARFARAQRKEKTLIRRKFLDALDAEIERVLVNSVEQAATNSILTLVVSLPKKAIKDRFLCDVRIKDRAKQVNPKAAITKQFLADLNTYTGAIILSSMEMITGVYLQDIAIGSATAKIADRKTPKSAPVGKQPPATTKPPRELGKIDPPQLNTIEYILHTQQQQLRGVIPITAVRTDKQLHHLVERIVGTSLSSMGVKSDGVIEVVKITRAKITREKR